MDSSGHIIWNFLQAILTYSALGSNHLNVRPSHKSVHRGVSLFRISILGRDWRLGVSLDRSRNVHLSRSVGKRPKFFSFFGGDAFLCSNFAPRSFTSSSERDPLSIDSLYVHHIPLQPRWLARSRTLPGIHQSSAGPSTSRDYPQPLNSNVLQNAKINHVTWFLGGRVERFREDDFHQRAIGDHHRNATLDRRR